LDVTLELRNPDLVSYQLDEIPGASAAARKLRNSWLTGQ